MHYAAIKTHDIANGPGVRVSLFVSGCRNHCKGCFQKETWDFSYGVQFDDKAQESIFAALAPTYMAGVTLLGGEPFEPENQRGLLPFVKLLREKYPKKTIWAFSGFTLADLFGETPSRARCEVTDELLSYLDVLVDGPFVEEKRDLMLKFRGSTNQRLLDMPKSLAAKKAVLWEG